MEYIYPDYYDSFQCIAGACPKTCCSGWLIEIDEESLKKYKTLGIKTVNQKEQSFFHDAQKNCLNLREDGLCALIIEHGEEILCKTCRTFPRHVEEFQNVREYSLSISCPEVAKMLLSRKEKMVFYSQDKNVEDLEAYEETEQMVYGYLRKLRKEAMKIAQDRSSSISERMGRILAMAALFQQEMDFYLLENTEDPFDMDCIWNADYIHLELPPEKEKLMFYAMREWEFTNEEFPDILDVAEGILFQENLSFAQEYEEMKAVLQKQGVDLSIIFEQLMVYFIYTYLCGSAYDEYYFGQTQTAMAACVHIRQLLLAQWKQTGEICFADIIRYTYLYARELEHSIPNVLKMEAYMDSHPLI